MRNDAPAILIVEDDLAIRETLTMAVELEGYPVHAAANGKEAVELLSSIPKPRLILLDLMMPVMDGWQFVTWIRQTAGYADIPIILTTAFANQAEDLPVNGVLRKPLDLDDLFQTIRRWAGGVT